MNLRCVSKGCDSIAFKSGFRLGLSQLIGFAQGVYPVDVAVDYARLSVSARQIRQNRDSLVQLAVLMPDQAAVVPVTPAPVLVLKRSPGGLTLQWPLSATGMVLETTATLAPADWAPVTNTPIPVGDQVELQIPTTNASQFFQLRPAGN